MVPPVSKVTSKTPGLAGIRYQTGVPLLSNTMAYVPAPPFVTMFPVKYHPGVGVPGLVTLNGGKSCGRHRIQYWTGAPLGLLGSGALTISAWFSMRLS